MAKAKAGNGNQKISFGKKKKGKAKRSYSKYEQKPKLYQGQGRLTTHLQLPPRLFQLLLA